MLLAQTGCLLMGFILCISGVEGRVNRICALKATSVNLSCSAEHPNSNLTWHTVRWDGYKFVQGNFSEDGNRTYVSEESNFTLMLNDVRESDNNFYCCKESTDITKLCWSERTELHVTDLQVKVIPTTEGLTVTLMCSTRCLLTEEPAAYIWYKNREFLYEDWSPWYQELVSSEEAVTYSCAIKGYEDLRAPEVSVDLVTPTCFTVTYAKGSMCSYVQKSEDEPCSITYPSELHVQRTHLGATYFRQTCIPSCPLTDPQTAYRWYQHRRLYRLSEAQHLTVPHGEVSCAVKGHKDLFAPEVCSKENICQTVNYASRRLCAVEGSSVYISSEYQPTPITYPNMPPKSKFWYKVKRRGEAVAEKLTEDDRLQYHDDMKNHHTLGIYNLMKNDSAEYIFRLLTEGERWGKFDFPGVTLVVTGLRVTMTPSAVVTEGQRVTLTCSTSCPLTNNTNYVWYLNSRPLTLPENQTKHLVLDPVSSQHAGNYSCAARTHEDLRSPEVTLTVQALETLMAIINAVRLTVAFLILIPLPLLHLWMRVPSDSPKSQNNTNTPRDQGSGGPATPVWCKIILLNLPMESGLER